MVGGILEFGILGPVEVARNGKAVKIRAPKQRAVLALLLLDANHVVSVDALIDGLWCDDPPPTATAALQVHVAKLRQALGSGGPDDAASLIVTRAPGYAIEIEPGALDLTRFEGYVERARAAIAAERPAEASALFGQALSLWRGPALADLAHERFASVAAARLEEERVIALEQRIDADLARGAHAELIGELRELTAWQPLREHLWGQLMVALYRSGRQGDALAAYQSARSVLRDELGLEPGEALRALENDVLRQADHLVWVADDPQALSARSPTTALDHPEPLVVAHLAFDGRSVPLGNRCTIGREVGNAIVVDDAKVSREHAEIVATPLGFVLIDLRSTNGTTVNGRRVTEHTLGHGDRIMVGSTELGFVLEAE